MTARVQSQCTPSCARYRSPLHPANTTGVIACDAFPAGIPEDIWENRLDHRQPVDGDHGLRWTAAPGYSFPTYAFQPDVLGHGTVVAAGADGEPRTGAMIALLPADPDALAIPGGEAADQLHCTVLYLGEAVDIAADVRARIVADVEKTVADWSEIQADGFGLAAFNPTGDEPCLVLLLSGEDLADAHGSLAELVDTAVEAHRPWIPHVTLAYTDDLPMISDLLDLIGPVGFDRVRVAFGDDITDITLLEPADGAEEPEPAEVDVEEQAPPPAGAQVASRVVWGGCPRCFKPVHDGPCNPGL